MPEKKKSVVPPLRFPEFRDAGEWERYRFRELLTLEYGASLPEESRLGGAIPVVGSNGVVGFHNQALISGPAIIVGRKGSVGEINWIELDCYPIDTTFYVKLESQDTLLAFIKLLLENANLTCLSDNGAVPGLNRNDVYVLKTALPREAEQQKIADCLSSLDEVIDLEAQKLEALKAHKKGLMQQLFPREGETTPRLRFPEFRDEGEWERYRFRELLTLEYGASLPEESRLGGAIPVVGSNGVVGFHNQALISGPAIIVGRKGSVGEINWIELDCYPIDTTFYVKLESQDTLLAFIKLLLENANLTCLSDNGAVPGLNRNDVYVLKTALPREAEQQKIADCLSSLDEVIDLQTQKLDALKAHKKGLMQQLFPSEVD